MAAKKKVEASEAEKKKARKATDKETGKLLPTVAEAVGWIKAHFNVMAADAYGVGKEFADRVRVLISDKAKDSARSAALGLYRLGAAAKDAAKPHEDPDDKREAFSKVWVTHYPKLQYEMEDGKKHSPESWSQVIMAVLQTQADVDTVLDPATRRSSEMVLRRAAEAYADAHGYEMPVLGVGRQAAAAGTRKWRLAVMRGQQRKYVNAENITSTSYLDGVFDSLGVDGLIALVVALAPRLTEEKFDEMIGLATDKREDAAKAAEKPAVAA